MQAIQVYRDTFQPSAYLDKPYVMLGFNVFAADNDDEAHFPATSWQQSFVNLRSGRPSRLPAPVRTYIEQLGPAAQDLLAHVLSCSAIGAPDTVARQLKAFIRSEEHTSELQSLM